MAASIRSERTLNGVRMTRSGFDSVIFLTLPSSFAGFPQPIARLDETPAFRECRLFWPWLSNHPRAKPTPHIRHDSC
jgi:hypothetical protein